MDSFKWQNKLREPEWREKREEIFERDHYQCQECGIYGESRNLNCHHIKYIRDLNPWDYPDELLITLCEECHAHKHGKESIRDILNKISNLDREWALRQMGKYVLKTN